MITGAHLFQGAPLSKCFSPRRKAGVFKFPGLKSVFVNLRFCDGLVWTEGLTMETDKALFQIPAT